MAEVGEQLALDGLEAGRRREVVQWGVWTPDGGVEQVHDEQQAHRIAAGYLGITYGYRVMARRVVTFTTSWEEIRRD